jgi:hypothetical protein
MDEKRSIERVFPKDFQDFNVHLKLEDITINGTLGNLSEEGMCAIVPGTGESIVSALARQKEVSGVIEGRRIKGMLDVKGKVVWTELRHSGEGEMRYLGIRFDENVELPESVIALCMSDEN